MKNSSESVNINSFRSILAKPVLYGAAERYICPVPSDISFYGVNIKAVHTPSLRQNTAVVRTVS